MVSTVRLVIEACFRPLIYSMYAGCHFSSAKLLCAKAECLLLLICMVSALRLDCLWRTYLSTNCLSMWWDFPFGKMDTALHCSASSLQHLWFLTGCFFHRLLGAFGWKASGTTNVKLAKKLLMLSEVCTWGCGFASSEQLESSPCPKTFCSAVGALHVLFVQISRWCWWALAVLAAESTGTFLLQWKFLHWHIFLWCHIASFPKLFILQGHSDSSEIYIPHFVLVIPESFLLSELLPLDLLTQRGLRVVVFLFTVNILQHFKWYRWVSPLLVLLMTSKFSKIRRQGLWPLTWPALRRVCQVFVSQSNTRLHRVCWNYSQHVFSVD